MLNLVEQAEFEALEADVNDALDAVETAVAGLFDEVDAITPRLDALEARLTALEAATSPEPLPEPSEPAPSLPEAPSARELLAVDWSPALGNSVAAVGDGGKGTMRWCDWAQVLSVEPDLHPTHNALAIRSTQGCGHVEFPDLFPTPQAGQVWTVGYDIMQEAGQTDTKMHPMCFWPVGAIEAVHISIAAQGGGSWTPHPRFGWGTAFPYGARAYQNGQQLVVQPGQWVRYEFELEWTGPTTYVPRMRLLNLDGSLLTDDFRGTEWPFLPVGSAVCTCVDPQHMRTPSFGMGQAGSSGARYFVARARFGVR